MILRYKIQFDSLPFWSSLYLFVKQRPFSFSVAKEQGHGWLNPEII